MVYCEECGSKIPDDSVFCENCGFEINLINTEKTSEREIIVQEEIEKDSIYRKWWFWLIVGILLMVGLLFIFWIFTGNMTTFVAAI